MPHCPVTVVQRYRDGVCSLLFHLFFIICHPYIPLHLEEMIFYTCFTHFLTVPNAPSKTMLEYRCKKDMLIPLIRSTRGSNSDRTRYDATLQTSTLCYTIDNRAVALYYLWLHSPVINRFITRVRAGEVGVAHYPKWRRSLLIHAETRDFHSRRGIGARTIAWGLCTPLTIVDQFGIKISGFTPSFEALGRLLKKKKKKKKKKIDEIRKSRMSDFSCEKTKVCMDS